MDIRKSAEHIFLLGIVFSIALLVAELISIFTFVGVTITLALLLLFIRSDQGGEIFFSILGQNVKLKVEKPAETYTEAQNLPATRDAIKREDGK